MDFRQLRYFVEIVDSGSFSKASERLHIAQPALSQHVLALERELGVCLLGRHARGVRMNEMGKIVYDRAMAILHDVEEVKTAVAKASASPVAEISVGLPTSACRGLMVPLTQAVTRAYPTISLHIVEAMSGALEEWVVNGRLDVALIYEQINAKQSGDGSLIEHLHAIVASPEQLGIGKSMTFEEFCAMPLVLPRSPNVVRLLAETLAAEIQRPLNVSMNCDSFGGLIEMVQEGYVGLMPKFAIADALERKTLSAIEITDPVPRWAIATRVSPVSKFTQSAFLVNEVLQQSIRKLIEDGVWDRG